LIYNSKSRSIIDGSDRFANFNKTRDIPLFIIAQLKESNQPGEGLIGLDLGAVFPSIKSNVASSDGSEWNGLS
jgi:hypothetical protein